MGIVLPEAVLWEKDRAVSPRPLRVPRRASGFVAAPCSEIKPPTHRGKNQFNAINTQNDKKNSANCREQASD